MRTVHWFATIWLASAVVLNPGAWPQARPYIGFVYPAGGQQSTTFQIRLGGQNMDDADTVLVTGEGVTARIIQYEWRLDSQEQSLLNEQLRYLKRTSKADSSMTNRMIITEEMKTSAQETVAGTSSSEPMRMELIARLQQRLDDYVPTPACISIATLLFAEVTIAPDAPPGDRKSGCSLCGGRQIHLFSKSDSYRNIPANRCALPRNR